MGRVRKGAGEVDVPSGGGSKSGVRRRAGETKRPGRETVREERGWKCRQDQDAQAGCFGTSRHTHTVSYAPRAAGFHTNTLFDYRVICSPIATFSASTRGKTDECACLIISSSARARTKARSSIVPVATRCTWNLLVDLRLHAAKLTSA